MPNRTELSNSWCSGIVYFSSAYCVHPVFVSQGIVTFIRFLFSQIIFHVELPSLLWLFPSLRLVLWLVFWTETDCKATLHGIFSCFQSFSNYLILSSQYFNRNFWLSKADFVFGQAPNLRLFKSIFKNSDNSYQNLNLHQLNSMLRVAIFSSLQEYHTSLSWISNFFSSAHIS